MQSFCTFLTFLDFDALEKRSNEDIEDYLPQGYIINVGRLEYRKNQKGLIMAFKRVAEARPKESLVIVDGGCQKDELQRLIQDLDREGKVFLFGYR